MRRHQRVLSVPPVQRRQPQCRSWKTAGWRAMPFRTRRVGSRVPIHHHWRAWQPFDERYLNSCLDHDAWHSIVEQVEAAAVGRCLKQWSAGVVASWRWKEVHRGRRFYGNELKAERKNPFLGRPRKRATLREQFCGLGVLGWWSYI